MFKMSQEEEIIAQLVTREDIVEETKRQGRFNILGGIFNLRQAVIGPGEVAVLVRNGKIEDVLTQTKLTRLSGGLSNWIANIFAGGEDLQLLFIETAPTDLEMGISGVSKSGTEVQGTCTVRVQINPADALKVWNLMRGRKELRKADLEEKLSNETAAMVFSTLISKYDPEDFKGNVAIQKELEATATVEMRKTLEMWGLTLLRMFTVWGRSDYDELMKYKRTMAMWDGRQESYHQGNLAHLRRVHEATKKEQEQRWELRLGEVSWEEKEKMMRVEAEVSRERLVWDEKQRQFVARSAAETQAVRERAIAEQEIEDMEAERALRMFKEVQEQKRLREAQKLDFAKDQTSSIERLMQQAIATGDYKMVQALQEVARQQTMQQMATRESEKVAALAEAEKARYTMDAYKSAEDREREYEVKRMELTAKQMEAAKQPVPQTVVQGATTPVMTPIITAQKTQISPEEPTLCPSCGNPLKPSWKVCPECGTSLRKS